MTVDINAQNLYRWPTQKWKQHGRFPFKMVLHLCLLGVATVQVRCQDRLPARAKLTQFLPQTSPTHLLYVLAITGVPE